MEKLVGLIAPWYVLANEIKYTYGMSPFVNVEDLVEGTGGNYYLPIKVKKDSVADALRQILPLSFQFGNITVNIVVYNSRGEIVTVNNIVYTEETLAKLFCTALKMNPLFKGAVIRPEGFPGTIPNVTLVIAKEVIQFYNDDISQLCRNFNEVAAKVFGDVTNSSFSPNLVARFSTYDPKCKLQKNIYCPMKPKKHECY